jgi:hypothetical protein
MERFLTAIAAAMRRGDEWMEKGIDHGDHDLEAA